VSRDSAGRAGNLHEGHLTLIAMDQRCDPHPLLNSLSSVEGLTDSELIDRILAGEADAFSVLLGRYQSVCTRFAVRMLASRTDADDALQSAFMRAFRGLRSCRDRERFGGWLYQIVVNECRSFATRQRKRELKFVADPDAIDRAVSIETDNDSGSSMTERIESALARLPVDQREAFLLKHVEEMSYEEMAAITGLSISALKMRVKRAADGLRELLEGAYHDR
jgi:RNA polymerase sigma-70 factor, ECF subfamily